MLFTIDSLDDHPNLLQDYMNLKDTSLRKKLEPNLGIYLAESLPVITRALEAGHQPRSILLTKRWLPQIQNLLSNHKASGFRPDGGDIALLVASTQILEKIVGFHLHRGALASMYRPKLPAPSQFLTDLDASKPQRILILEDLADSTNVGAAFRAAAGIGFDGVLVTPHCADPLYRRSVRVSMGAVFQIPWTRLNTWPDLSALHANNFTVAALALREDAIDLAKFCKFLDNNPKTNLALVVGTEGEGLSRKTIAETDYVVRIPMHGRVDSLNVASACALACWATRNKNN